MPLTDTELQSILSTLDDVMHQTRELSEQIKTRMADQRNPDTPAANWKDSRNGSERRKRPQG
jgi:hypothetical protein